PPRDVDLPLQASCSAGVRSLQCSFRDLVWRRRGDRLFSAIDKSFRQSLSALSVTTNEFSRRLFVSRLIALICASEIRGIVGASASFVPGYLRICAKRAGACYRAFRIGTLSLDCNYLIRSYALFDPAFKCQRQVMLSVRRRATDECSEAVRSRTAA